MLSSRTFFEDPSRFDFRYWRSVAGGKVSHEQKSHMHLPDIMPLLEVPFPELTAADFGETRPEMVDHQVYPLGWGGKKSENYGEIVVEVLPPPAIRNTLSG
jgi:hypothetical protein